MRENICKRNVVWSLFRRHFLLKTFYRFRYNKNIDTLINMITCQLVIVGNGLGIKGNGEIRCRHVNCKEVVLEMKKRRHRTISIYPLF